MNHRMLRVFALPVLLVAAIGLSACGGSSDDDRQAFIDGMLEEAGDIPADQEQCLRDYGEGLSDDEISKIADGDSAASADASLGLVEACPEVAIGAAGATGAEGSTP